MRANFLSSAEWKPIRVATHALASRLIAFEAFATQAPIVSPQSEQSTKLKSDLQPFAARTEINFNLQLVCLRVEAKEKNAMTLVRIEWHILTLT